MISALPDIPITVPWTPLSWLSQAPEHFDQIRFSKFCVDWIASVPRDRLEKYLEMAILGSSGLWSDPSLLREYDTIRQQMHESSDAKVFREIVSDMCDCVTICGGTGEQLPQERLDRLLPILKRLSLTRTLCRSMLEAATDCLDGQYLRSNIERFEFANVIAYFVFLTLDFHLKEPRDSELSLRTERLCSRSLGYAFKAVDARMRAPFRRG